MAKSGSFYAVRGDEAPRGFEAGSILRPLQRSPAFEMRG